MTMSNISYTFYISVTKAHEKKNLVDLSLPNQFES